MKRRHVLAVSKSLRSEYRIFETKNEPHAGKKENDCANMIYKRTEQICASRSMCRFSDNETI